MKALECIDCGWLGNNPTERETIERDGFAHGPFRREVEDACPECGSTDLEDIEVCDQCIKSSVFTRTEGARCARHQEADDEDAEVSARTD